MQDVFDEDELQPEERRRDTELTLGPMLLLGIFFGLVLLCGLSFGLGFTMGSHGGHESPLAGQQPGVGASSSAAGSLTKPSAAPQPLPPPPERSVVSVPPTVDSAIESATASQSPGTPIANSAQPVVKPALPVVTPAGAPNTATANVLMVQIAAVSHQEDANVLLAALRKRGYAVNTSRDAADGLYHVRIGPFAKRGDAEATRQNLLNDGYNAIVQQ